MLKFVVVLGGQSGIQTGYLHQTLLEIYQRPMFRVFGISEFVPAVQERSPQYTMHDTLQCAARLAGVGHRAFPGANLYVGVQGSVVPPFPACNPFVTAWAGTIAGPAGMLSLSPPVYDRLFFNICMHKNSFTGSLPATLGVPFGDTLDKTRTLVAFLETTLEELGRS